jgi:hypothetical protein
MACFWTRRLQCIGREPSPADRRPGGWRRLHLLALAQGARGSCAGCCVGAGHVWNFWVTEYQEDQSRLIQASNAGRWQYRPSVSCFIGNPRAPISHPNGAPGSLARCGGRVARPEAAAGPLPGLSCLSGLSAETSPAVAAAESALLKGGGLRCDKVPSADELL